MQLKKIALWVFIAILISGLMFGVSLASDVSRLGGWNNAIIGVGQQYDVNDIEEVELNNIKTIKVNMSSSDTTVVLGNSNKVRAALTGQVRTTNPAAVPQLTSEVSGDTLIISELRTPFSVGFYNSNVKMDLTIPESFKGELQYEGSSSELKIARMSLTTLSVVTSSGDIHLGNITLNSSFTVKTSSGSFSCDSVEASDAFLESSSGDKKIKSLQATGDVTLKSSSGESIIDRVSCRNLSMEARSGNTKVGNIKAESTTGKSSSGVYSIDSLDGSASITTSSADVTVKCNEPEDKVEIHTTSGVATLSMPERSGFTLNADTNSGEITSKFKLNDSDHDEDYLRGTYGDGSIAVRIQTSSGDISIEKM